MRFGTALPVSVVLLAGAALPAGACGPMATVRFVESSPADRFEIVNNSSDAWDVAHVELTLDGSAGALIFDTLGGGAGTSMFQPFVPAPAEFDAVVPMEVGDGTRTLALDFAGFRPGAAFAFTIDVDDTLLRSELGPMRVTESEIEGALAQALFRAPDGEEMVLDGHFGPDGIAIVSGLACS
jgi:hypothetical protein